MLGVVESEGCSGIQINERCSAPLMVGGDGAQFFPCNRMPDEDRIREVQGINHRDDIISEPLWVISGLRRGGLSDPTPRNPSDVIMRRELRTRLSKTWAVFPRPARSTRLRPVPPQS